MAPSLTESAASRVRDHPENRGSGIGLRLGVTKTGCSGYAYAINYADEIATGDVVFEDKAGRRRPGRASLIDGTEVDFVKSGLNEAFSFGIERQRQCGCGESADLRPLPAPICPNRGFTSPNSDRRHFLYTQHKENRMAVEQTLSIIKPDGVQKNLIGEILAASKRQAGNRRGTDDAPQYRAGAGSRRAQGAAAFHDLVAYMTSGPVVVQPQGENAIAKNREMGATNPADAAPYDPPISPVSKRTSCTVGRCRYRGDRNCVLLRRRASVRVRADVCRSWPAKTQKRTCSVSRRANSSSFLRHG